MIPAVAGKEMTFCRLSNCAFKGMMVSQARYLQNSLSMCFWTIHWPANSDTWLSAVSKPFFASPSTYKGSCGPSRSGNWDDCTASVYVKPVLFIAARNWLSLTCDGTWKFIASKEVKTHWEACPVPPLLLSLLPSHKASEIRRLTFFFLNDSLIMQDIAEVVFRFF